MMNIKTKKYFLLILVPAIVVLITATYLSEHIKYQATVQHRALYMEEMYNALWNSHDAHRVLFYREETDNTEPGLAIGASAPLGQPAPDGS